MRDAKAEKGAPKLKRKRALETEQEKRGTDQKRREEKKKEALKLKEKEGWNRERCGAEAE